MIVPEGKLEESIMIEFTMVLEGKLEERMDCDEYKLFYSFTFTCNLQKQSLSSFVKSNGFLEHSFESS